MTAVYVLEVQMSGPLPDPNRRRRNAPTIPTTGLPASGRPGPVPKPPAWVHLAASGLAWWAWAWKTPQAAAWSDGHLVFVARRAEIEDERTALHEAPVLDIADLLEMDDEDEGVRQLEWIVRTLHRLATGKTTLDREARELDDRLGLSPKGQAALRWTIIDTAAAKEAKPKRQTASRRLKVVDGKAG